MVLGNIALIVTKNVSITKTEAHLFRKLKYILMKNRVTLSF